MRRGWLIYTDGSVIDGIAGWAYAVYLSESFQSSFNGRLEHPPVVGRELIAYAETMAAIAGLASVDSSLKVTIVTDHVDLWQALSGQRSVITKLQCWPRLQELMADRDLKPELLRGRKNLDERHKLVHGLARQAARGY